jgi:Ca-activated chloride channel family protein
MLAEDVVPSRLEKQIVSQIINQLGNDRIGIVAYAGSAFPVCPSLLITVWQKCEH